MELTVISVGANRVELSILMEKGDGEKNISVGAVMLTFRSKIREYYSEYYLSLKLTTDKTKENEMYICFLNSETLKMKDTRYICDDSFWRDLYEGEGIVKIDLTVVSEVVPIQSQFSYFYDDTELTDFELRGEDNSLVQVHSFVLAASSPVFRAMLGKQCKETADRSYHIKDATQTTLQHLKDFMYNNTIPETGVEELFQLAHCYMMPELEKGCSKRLLDNLSAANVLEMMKFAFTNEFPKFHIAMLQHIESGAVKIKDMKIE